MSDIITGSLILGICSIVAAGVHGFFRLRWQRKEKIMDAVIEMHRNGIIGTDPVRKHLNKEHLNDFVELLKKFDDVF